MAPAGTKPQEGKNEGHCIELTMCAVLGLLVINGHRVLISKQCHFPVYLGIRSIIRLIIMLNVFAFCRVLLGRIGVIRGGV